MSNPTESRRDSIVPEWSRPVLLGGVGSLLGGALLVAVAWGQFTSHVESQAQRIAEQAERITKVVADHTSYRELTSGRVRAVETRIAEIVGQGNAQYAELKDDINDVKQSLVRLEDRFGTNRRGDDR